MILAIDPGSNESAYCVWSGSAVLSHAILPNREMLKYLRYGRPSYRQAVIEMVGHYGKGMPAGKEVFDTCCVIGRFEEAWEDAQGSQLERVMRLDVKLHLCGSAKAKDGNVRQALIDRFGPVGKKATPGVLYGIASHVWAALALAVYAHDKQRVAA